MDDDSIYQENKPTMINPNKTRIKSLRLAIIVLVILTLGFAGLSIYLLINQPTTTSKSEAEQVTASDTVDAKYGPYIDDGYFYVPHWKTKFKLSDELTNYGYSVTPNDTTSSYDNYVLGLTAIFKKDLKSDAMQRYFATIETCSFITITKTTQNTSNVSGPKKVVKDGNSSYVIYDYQANPSCPEIDADDSLYNDAYYDKVADKLTEIISSPETF